MIETDKWYVLKVKKNMQTLIWFQLYYLMFYGFFRDIFGMSNAISYVLDLTNIIIFAYAILNRKILQNEKKYYVLICGWIGAYVLFTLIGIIVVNGSWILYLWGARNTFRYYIFFISCVIFLKMEDIYKIKSFFKKIFYVNVAACMIEYFMGYSGDYVGGTFGTVQGVNGYLNLLLVIFTAIIVVDYIDKKSSLKSTAINIILCCCVMALAELKVYVFELIIIMILAIAKKGTTTRKLTVIILGCICVGIAIILLGSFFKNSGESFFNIDTIFDYAGDSGYTGNNDLNRFNAVLKINDNFFRNSNYKKIFGYGLGNCSFSSISSFTSVFYRKYNSMHYQWFSDALVYIETGLVGLVFFEGFFVIIYGVCKKILKRIAIEENKIEKKELENLIKITSIVAVMSIVNSIYNSALSMDAGYMSYFMLAIPLIIHKRSGTLGR